MWVRSGSSNYAFRLAGLSTLALFPLSVPLRVHNVTAIMLVFKTGFKNAKGTAEYSIDWCKEANSRRSMGFQDLRTSEI